MLGLTWVKLGSSGFGCDVKDEISDCVWLREGCLAVG